MENWTEEAGLAITVLDERGVIISMNAKAATVFAKDGGKTLIGKNALDCHPEPARTKLADMLKNPRANAYTIEKNGIKKLIYQTPWYKEGKFMGLVELSMEIPFDMPHHVRTPKPDGHGG
ncbi:MAG: hypothetical protein WCS77_07150 [Elusimicrobiaceae bacterium]